MNGPVDVLAWLDSLHATTADGAITNRKWPEAQEAHAAVAELIEAVRFYADERNWSSTSVMERGAAIEEDGGNKARAALARVGAK